VLTVAIAVDAVDHATLPVLMDAPCWSVPAAVAVADWPTSMLVLDKDTVTVVSVAGLAGPPSVDPPLHDTTDRSTSTDHHRDPIETFLARRPCRICSASSSPVSTEGKTSRHAV
jgi:hypothetical protein